MKHKFLIYYSNNTLESVVKLNDTLTRLIDTGVVTFIYDVEKNEIIGKTQEGIKNIKINLIE